jgi:thiosulfate/3-mercaptopyruvate sulfurtransferase
MITLAPALLALAVAVQAPRDPMLVSAEWLIQHQHDPKLVLIQVGPRATYDSSHIAGAVYVPFTEMAAPNDSTKPALELPSPARLDSALEALGISDDSRIVIYSSDEWISPSTRVYLTLYWAGLGARTSLLDGGLEIFRARGGAVTAAATPAPRRGTLTLHPRSDVVVEAPWVASHLNDPSVALIDARNTRFYLGNYPVRAGGDSRPGHIPGAFNIEFGTVVDDSTKLFWTAPRIHDLLRTVHAEDGDTVVTYCHIGQQGTVVWFAAKLAGYEARLYDGSFTQWSNLNQYAVEK